MTLPQDDPRPLLLVDVDGVLNPWQALRRPAGFTEHFFPGSPRVWLSAAHGELLNSLAGAFELVWATAWEEDANTYLAPVLSLPPLPVIEFSGIQQRGLVFAKLPAVIAAVGDRPCAWIDDQHGAEHRAWAAGRQAPTLILDIDPAVGLTAAVAGQLAAWAADLAPGRPAEPAGPGGAPR